MNYFKPKIFEMIIKTKNSSAALEHLQELTKLQWLELDDTQVSDAGLEHLKGLTELSVLVLADTQVTDDGVKKLREALTDCEIEH